MSEYGCLILRLITFRRGQIANVSNLLGVPAIGTSVGHLYPTSSKITVWDVSVCLNAHTRL